MCKRWSVGMCAEVRLSQRVEVLFPRDLYVLPHTVAGSHITYWQKHTGWGETDPALPLGYHNLCSLKIPHLLPPYHCVLLFLFSKIIFKVFFLYFLSIALNEKFLSCLAFPFFTNPMLVLWVLCAITCRLDLLVTWACCDILSVC